MLIFFHLYECTDVYFFLLEDNYQLYQVSASRINRFCLMALFDQQRKGLYNRNAISSLIFFCLVSLEGQILCLYGRIGKIIRDAFAFLATGDTCCCLLFFCSLILDITFNGLQFFLNLFIGLFFLTCFVHAVYIRLKVERKRKKKWFLELKSN